MNPDIMSGDLNLLLDRLVSFHEVFREFYRGMCDKKDYE